MALSLLGYLADAWILATYALLAKTARPRPFHLANALGCVPLIAIEITVRAWPVIPLTASFGAIGAFGLWKDRT